MTTNRLRHLLAAAVLFSLVAAPARADLVSVGNLVTVTIAPSYLPGFDVSRANNGYTGGPFKITNDSTNPKDEWITFCIERGQNIDDGQQYRVKAVGNSTSGQVPVAKQLSDEAAWLYEAFRMNGLGGLSAIFGAEFVASNATHTKILQYAMWLAQDFDLLNSGLQGDEGTRAQALLDHAKLQNSSGIVRIVQLEQLVDGTWVDSQDVLALQPVPEPASMALLGLGLAGVAAARRRQRQAR